jgi:hypothetical protein
VIVLRSKVAIIGAVVALAVAGTAAGVIYATTHARPNHHTLAAAPVGKVGSTTTGSTTVGQAPSAEFLTVINTTPSANAQGAAVNTPVTVSFNLPVWPASVQNFFSVLPAVAGTFGQGNTPTDVVFTPSSNFATGSSVNVVIRQGLTSRDGFGLQNDYSFTFGTEVSDQGVSFQANNMMATLFNLPSGRTVNVALQLGAQVPPDVAVKIYKASSNDLLPALVHSAIGQYNSNPIDTSAMQLLDTKSGVKNNDQFLLTEPDGVYLILATSSRGQHGAMWLDVSKYGVLLRQDDQKVVVAGEDLTTGDTTPNFSIAFYKLTDSVQKVASGTFTGTGEFAIRYPNTLDLAIASTSGEDVVVPISTPATNADVKVVGDLAQQAQIFLTTDRAAYSAGETAKFYGVVRLSNDQAYTVPPATQIDVWNGQSPNRLVDQKVSTAPDGTFSGSFAVPAGAFNPNGTDGQLTLYASLQSSQPTDFTTFNTVIQTLGPHSPSAKVTVGFDKPDYVARDTIVVTFTGPATKAVNVTVYSTQHQAQPREMDAFPAPTTWGVAVKQNVTVTLDANGHGTYSVAANAAQVSADQQVTVTATYGSGSTAALGARSTIVYQAADEVFLLPSRAVYVVGETVNAPFVAETRGGDRLANVPVAYEFDKTDYQGNTSTTTVVQSGTVTTDTNGIGVVHVQYTGAATGVELHVKGKDTNGNVFQDVKWLNIGSDASAELGFANSGVLVQLSVSADKVAYGVGDTAHITITSPSARNVLLSIERGRIHQYRWLALAQGDTPLSLPITADLAPGFAMTFTYIDHGNYISEATTVSVSNAAQMLALTLTPDHTAYTAGQTAHVTVAVTDSAGKPVQGTILVDAYDSAMSAYKLQDQNSLGQVFFTPAPRGTNASSSLIGIGNYGGRCGGGFNQGQPAATNPGQLAAWTTVTTDASGHATIDVPLAKAAVRLAILATTSNTLVGQAETDLAVQ